MNNELKRWQADLIRAQQESAPRDYQRKTWLERVMTLLAILSLFALMYVWGYDNGQRSMLPADLVMRADNGEL